jgi:hypothetical protein
MAERKGDGRKSFAEFLKNAPTLEAAAADDSVEISGLVSRTTEGRFAITTDSGHTYELDVEAVRDFRALDVPGATSAAAIRIGRDLLSEEALRPIKPTFKDMIKDPIKDIIHDGKHMITDPIVDHKSPLKDIHKDPLTDPNTLVQERVGTGAADPIGGFDPGLGPVVNPAAPFVMATPHQAPQHLLAMQAGVQAAPLAAAATPFGADNTVKEVPLDTIKEVHTDTKKEMVIDTQKEVTADTFKEIPHDTHKELVSDTRKELVSDTHKELILDTRKEMVWDTHVEGGTNTLQEGTFDPGQLFGGPQF